MTPASASPIATQETEVVGSETARNIVLAWLRDDRTPLGVKMMAHPRVLNHLRAGIDEALSASEKRNEELVRELDEAIRQQIDLEAEARSLKAENASHTGLVGDMREKAAKVKRWLRDYIEADLDEIAADGGVTVGMIFQKDAESPAAYMDDIIRALELPAPAVSTTGEGSVIVPKAALDWLNGAGPDDKGRWFGDAPDRPRGSFWWRTEFKRLCSLPPVPGDPVEEGR